jgi:hypothetical protein
LIPLPVNHVASQLVVRGAELMKTSASQLIRGNVIVTHSD